MLHRWVRAEEHSALSLGNTEYLSWWPPTTGEAGYAAKTLVEDKQKIRRQEDIKYIIPYKDLEYHLMTRRMKKIEEDDVHNIFITSEWAIYLILQAGGMSELQLENIMLKTKMFERPSTPENIPRVRNGWIDLNLGFRFS